MWGGISVSLLLCEMLFLGFHSSKINTLVEMFLNGGEQCWGGKYLMLMS